MKWNLFKKIDSERGAVPIVEAAFAYPIVIFVVIIFFFLGTILYQQAQVESLTVRAAEKLAAYYTNPLIYKGIPTEAEKMSLDPYRVLSFSGGNAAKAEVEKYVNQQIQKISSSGISKIDAHIEECRVDNYVLYQVARVEIAYTIEYKPLELMGGFSILNYSTATSTAAGDPAEFIRNIDMILDYGEITGLSAKIRETVGKFF